MTASKQTEQISRPSGQLTARPKPPLFVCLFVVRKGLFPSFLFFPSLLCEAHWREGAELSWYTCCLLQRWTTIWRHFPCLSNRTERKFSSLLLVGTAHPPGKEEFWQQQHTDRLEFYPTRTPPNLPGQHLPAPDHPELWMLHCNQGCSDTKQETTYGTEQAAIPSSYTNKTRSWGGW